MRYDIVSSKVNKSFLDLFWDLSSDDDEQRSRACKKLLSHLRTMTNKKDALVDYTLIRLVKGLRSPSLCSRNGFGTALVAVLRQEKSIQMSTILSLFNKYIYSFRASDQKERTALNFAKIDSIQVLSDAQRLSSLTMNDHQQIIDTLNQIVQSGDRVCITRLQLVLSSVFTRSFTLQKTILKAYADRLIRPLWDDATSNVNDNEMGNGKRLLFVLRLQANSVVMATLKGVHGIFDIADKRLLKRFLACIKSSDEDIAVELLTLLKNSPNFVKLWTRIAAPVGQAETPIGPRIQVLRLALALALEVNPEELRHIFTEELIIFFQKQLSIPQLASHDEICAATSKLLQRLKPIIASKTKEKDEFQIDSNNDCRFPSPSLLTKQVVLSETLFMLISNRCPLFDATAAPKAPHLLSALLDCSTEVLSHEHLIEWAQQLQKLFLTEKDSTGILTPDRFRLHILSTLRQCVFALLSRCPVSDVRDRVQAFATEILDFFLLVSCSSLKNDLSPLVCRSACNQLGKTLSILIRRISLRAEMKEANESSSIGGRSAKEGLSLLVVTTKHLILTALKTCQADKSREEIVYRLKTSRAHLANIELEKISDTVGKWIVILHAITTLHLLSLHTNPSSPKEANLLTVIDDISEAFNHRLQPSAMEIDKDKDDNSSCPPEWSSVLTDAMLTLSIEPWRLLREVISATFSRLVSTRQLFAPSVKPDSIFEQFKKTKKKNAEKIEIENEEEQKEEEVEEEEETPIKLIMSISDSKSNAIRSRLLAEGEDDDESDDEDNSDTEEEGDTEFDRLDDFKNVDLDVDDNGEIHNKIKENQDEMKMEEYGDDDDDDDDDDFLTDEQMNKQDETLAAIFKATRITKMQAKTKKETIYLLKLRSFDFVESLLAYSPDANLFLPALHTALQLAVTAGRQKKSKSTAGKSEKANRATDSVVPQSRIFSAIDALRTQRSIDANEALAESIREQSDLLKAFIKAMFATCNNAIPDDKLIKCLKTVCEFLEFKKCSKILEPVVQTSMIEVLHEFLLKPRPSRAHQLLFTRFISSSPCSAKLASTILTSRIHTCFSSTEEVSGDEKNSGIFAQTAMLQLITAVTIGLAGSEETVSNLHSWVTIVLKTLIKHMFTSTTSVTFPWAKSQQFSQALFITVFECIKRDNSGLNELTSNELKYLLSFDRSIVQKSVRPYHSRILQLIHCLKTERKCINEVLANLSSSKKQLKNEAKRERRAKRKERSMKQAGRKRTVSGTIVEESENQQPKHSDTDEEKGSKHIKRKKQLGGEKQRKLK